MFLLPALCLSLCTGVLAGLHVDTTPVVQITLADFAVDTICPVKDVFEWTSIAHQHSEGCSHKHHHSIQNVTSEPTFPTSDPWTIYPTCSQNTTTQFCVFTSTTFHNGRGVSILTKPSIARIMARSQAFRSQRILNLRFLSENVTREPSFIVAPIPGKGMGMIATRTIERGDLIKSHPAIGIFHNEAVEKSSAHYRKHFAPLMKLAVDQLPLDSQNLFMSMAAHNEKEEPYIERIYTNTFGEDFGDEEHSIVIPETARLNHDCRPNAMYYFDAQTLMHYTHASRTIYAGEEITITYIDPLQTRRDRRAAIKRSWGFDCSCSLCSQEPYFVTESNRRIGQINKLTEAFNETGSDSRKVQGTPDMAEYLVTLYEQERLWSSVADAYRILALSWAARASEWQALRWGSKALEAGLVDGGPNGEGVRDMKALVSNVRAHWSWGINLGAK